MRSRRTTTTYNSHHHYTDYITTLYNHEAAANEEIFEHYQVIHIPWYSSICYGWVLIPLHWQPRTTTTTTLGLINSNFLKEDFFLIFQSVDISPFRDFLGSNFAPWNFLEPRCSLLDTWTSHAHAPHFVDDLINHLIVIDHLEKAKELHMRHLQYQLWIHIRHQGLHKHRT